MDKLYNDLKIEYVQFDGAQWLARMLSEPRYAELRARFIATHHTELSTSDQEHLYALIALIEAHDPVGGYSGAVVGGLCRRARRYLEHPDSELYD